MRASERQQSSPAPLSLAALSQPIACPSSCIRNGRRWWQGRPSTERWQDPDGQERVGLDGRCGLGRLSSVALRDASNSRVWNAWNESQQLAQAYEQQRMERQVKDEEDAKKRIAKRKRKKEAQLEARLRKRQKRREHRDTGDAGDSDSDQDDEPTATATDTTSTAPSSTVAETASNSNHHQDDGVARASTTSDSVESQQ